MKTVSINSNDELLRYYVNTMSVGVLMYAEPSTMVVLTNGDCWLTPTDPVYSVPNVSKNIVMGVERTIDNKYIVYAKGLDYNWTKQDITEGCYLSIKEIQDALDCVYDQVSDRDYANGIIHSIVDPLSAGLSSHIIGNGSEVHGLGNSSVLDVDEPVHEHSPSVSPAIHYHAVGTIYNNHSDNIWKWTDPYTDPVGIRNRTLPFVITLEIGNYIILANTQIYFDEGRGGDSGNSIEAVGKITLQESSTSQELSVQNVRRRIVGDIGHSWLTLYDLQMVCYSFTATEAKAYTFNMIASAIPGSVTTIERVYPGWYPSMGVVKSSIPTYISVTRDVTMNAFYLMGGQLLAIKVS